MKLEKYEDKSKKKKRIVLINISLIVLVSASFLLYKTFANFSEEVSFPMINGKVDYFGNSDVYFAFYKNDEKVEEMPTKDNKDEIIFSRGECDNGARIEWNEEEWAPLVKNLKLPKTKCSLYFKKQEYAEMGGYSVPIIETGDGLYKVTHDDLKQLGSEWNKTEYRYAGVNPNNYVSFNNEIWRIIGLVNVQTENGIEQRLKIIRVNGIANQRNFGNFAWDRTDDYTNNWTTSKLKDMLNEIYYNNGNGECYPGENNSNSYPSTCDFSGNGSYIKGLNEESKKMIDKNITWNVGSISVHNDSNVETFYERERVDNSYIGYPTIWSSSTDIKYNGIGLMYPSDYGYATNGGNLGRKSCFDERMYNWQNDYYSSECGEQNWLKVQSWGAWTLTQLSNADSSFYVFSIYSVRSIDVHSAYLSFEVWPVVYLTPSTKIINGKGLINEPFILQNES